MSPFVKVNFGHGGFSGVCRDLALMMENFGFLAGALFFMRMARRLEPAGPFINGKVRQYEYLRGRKGNG